MTPMLRSDRDQHIQTDTRAPLALCRAVCDRAQDFSALSQIIRTCSPEALDIDVPVPSTFRPSTKMVQAVPSAKIEAISQRLGISITEAIGFYIRSNDAGCPPDLVFLRAIPPPEIHCMQRGPYWIGDFYSTDMVVDVLAECGVVLQPGQTVLDYGCSSGSLIRLLAWAYPAVQCLGTDPVLSSVNWATDNVRAPNLRFLHQQQRPPLQIPSSSVDVITAISIFSHHGFTAGKLWFEELARILKPGGICLFTTHGVGAILDCTEHQIKPVDRYREIYANFLASGYVFEEVWLDSDEVGNVATSAEWGNTFFDVHMVCAMFIDQFDRVHLGRRTNQRNQDVYVIRKRGV